MDSFFQIPKSKILHRHQQQRCLAGNISSKNTHLQDISAAALSTEREHSIQNPLLTFLHRFAKKERKLTDNGHEMNHILTPVHYFPRILKKESHFEQSQISFQKSVSHEFDRQASRKELLQVQSLPQISDEQLPYLRKPTSTLKPIKTQEYLPSIEDKPHSQHRSTTSHLLNLNEITDKSVIASTKERLTTPARHASLEGKKTSPSCRARRCSFRSLIKQNKAFKSAEDFCDKCHMPELHLFLATVIEYRRTCELQSADLSFQEFVRIVQQFVEVNSEFEINVSDAQRSKVLFFKQSKDIFTKLLPTVSDRKQVFDQLYMEVESLFWTNVESRQAHDLLAKAVIDSSAIVGRAKEEKKLRRRQSMS